jgi:hypothetical protein
VEKATDVMDIAKYGVLAHLLSFIGGEVKSKEAM